MFFTRGKDIAGTPDKPEKAGKPGDPGAGELTRIAYQTRLGRCAVRLTGVPARRRPDGSTEIIDEAHLVAYVIDPLRQVVQYAPTEHIEAPREIVVHLGPAADAGVAEAPGADLPPTGAWLGSETPVDRMLEVVEPRWSLDEIYLPPDTRRRIETALKLLQHRHTLFHEWGLAKTVKKGRAAVLNFYGPPGTGKTITAEAIAAALGRPLLRVSYPELESKYVGETPKNIKRVFETAAQRNAVLVFDEADSFLGRRLTQITQAADYGVNVTRSTMFMEIERFDGVLIFTTNLLENYDPAFSRRILASVPFVLPDAEGRAQIWRVHIPPEMPLAADVDLAALGREFPMSGADIQDAVLLAGVLALEAGGPVSMAQFRGAARQVLTRYPTD